PGGAARAPAPWVPWCTFSSSPRRAWAGGPPPVSERGPPPPPLLRREQNRYVCTPFFVFSCLMYMLPVPQTPHLKYCVAQCFPDGLLMTFPSGRRRCFGVTSLIR